MEKTKKEFENQCHNEFDTLWKIYPNKQGKVKALQSYIKARGQGTTYEEVRNGLEKYLKYCEKEKSWYRPKHGSTYFNQQCWLDEIDEVEEEQMNYDIFGNIIV